MNLTLNAVYFCATSGNRWGKGLTLAAAKKAAGLTTKAAEKIVQFYVMAAILNQPTEDELKNMLACITASNIDGTPRYYQDDRTQKDTDMITAKHVGWLTIEKNYE